MRQKNWKLAFLPQEQHETILLSTKTNYFCFDLGCHHECLIITQVHKLKKATF